MAALLGRSDVRLVTLTGAGGTGKTALARAVAAPHPHVFVDLAPLTDPSLVLRTIAGAIGVDEDPDEELLDLVADALRTDPPLLVLDNLEHLAGAFGDVAALLVAAPATRILATSRTSLRLALEHEYRVEPLAVPALELTDVEELRRNASVQTLRRARTRLRSHVRVDRGERASRRPDLPRARRAPPRGRARSGEGARARARGDRASTGREPRAPVP